MSVRLDRSHAIVAAAFVIQAVVIGGMFAYGVFFKALETELGWSRTLLSGASSAAFIVMGVFAMLSGRLNDRLGPRRVLSVSGTLYGLGFVLMAVMDAPWQLYLFYGGLIGLGLSTHDVVTLSTVARWFPRRRGLMTAVVKVGTACGQMTIPLGVSALIAVAGWRDAAMLLGCGAGLILLLAAQVLRRDPGQQPVQPAGTGSRARAATAPESGVSQARALRTRQLWTLCACQFLFFPSLVTVPVHIAAHGMDMGMSQTAAASLLSAIGAVSILGRLAIGATVDRLGGRLALAACFAILLTSLVWLRLADAPWMLFAFVALYGIAHGGFFTAVSPTVAEYFGLSAHGAIFGVILFFGTLGGAIGPMLAGRVFDLTGSYDSAFVSLAVLAATGLALVLSLKPLDGDS